MNLNGILDTLLNRSGRQPLTSRAAAASFITAVAGQLALFGVDIDDHTQATCARLLWLALAAVPFAAGLVSRKHVTPAVDPRSGDGIPLAPVRPGHVIVPLTSLAPNVPGAVGDLADTGAAAVEDVAGIGAQAVDGVGGLVGDLARGVGDVAGRLIPGHRRKDNR